MLGMILLFVSCLALCAISSFVSIRTIVLSLFLFVYVWEAILFFPVTSSYRKLRKYDELQMKISYVEEQQVKLSLDEYVELHDDVEKYNEALHSLQSAHSSAWDGVLIGDEVLTMEEIPMPEWL